MSTETVAFGRGGGVKAAPKVAVAKVSSPGSAGMGGGVFNGTVNGKRGFQVGNKFGANRKGSGVVAAGSRHRAARKTVSKHIKAGTALSKEGRAAIKDSAVAARELQAARASVTQGRSADAKATRAVASGRAEPLPRPGSQPPPTPPTPPTNAAAVKAGAKEASEAKVARAHDSLKDLHALSAGGALKPTDIHAHVERIGRGTTKEELFAAAKKAGVNTEGIKHKTQLVEHLKARAHDAHEAAQARTRAAIPAEHPDTAPVEVQKATAHGPREAIPPKAEAGATTHAPERDHPTYSDRSPNSSGLGEKAHAQFLADRVPGSHAGPSNVSHGHEGDARIEKTILHAIDNPHVIAGGPGHADGGLVAIHKLRDHVEATHGDIGAARFDRILKAARADGKAETIAISDNRNMTQRELNRSIPGMNENIAYAVRRDHPSNTAPVEAAPPKKAKAKERRT